MNWKIFSTAFVSCLLTALPQNGVGCGPDEDPHDYFTSFFSRNAGGEEMFKPFYYTALLDFYDDWETDSIALEDDIIIKEWRNFANSKSLFDAAQLIYSSKVDDIRQLAEIIRGEKPLTPKFANNEFAQSLSREKNKAAAEYLLFAKHSESFSQHQEWDDNAKKDSLKINTHINQANEYFTRTTDRFLKSKYAFQRCKLAFYNNRFEDCIRWYDEYFTTPNPSAVQPLALSYKAGSQFRSGNKKAAAYTFSKAFAANDKNKKQNYLGFLWATNECDPSLETEYIKLAKDNKEKALMAGMFSLYGTSYRLENIKKVYELDPASPLLQVLAVREINKLEEQYFTPLLQAENGGKALYFNFDDEKQDLSTHKAQLNKTISLFENIFADKATSNPALYGAGAAYLSFINKDYDKAKNLTRITKGLKIDNRTTAQLQIIELLILASEEKQLTKDREAQILPAAKWLVEKAKKDPEYLLFCRNFFSQVLAQKYEQQGDTFKAALAYGIADLTFTRTIDGDDYYDYAGLYFLQHDMSTNQLLNLYELMNSKSVSAWDEFMISNSSFNKDQVIDVMGTSYLRDQDYKKSIEWLKKAGKLKLLVETTYNYKTNKETNINVDPLHDYLNDWQRLGKTVAKPYTKLSLAQKLLELQTKADTTKNTEARSKLYYQWASILYNMSYYGNSWNAVAYERSGSDWNHGNYKLAWEKEYYGVHKAKELYQKAYDIAKLKEFKASCLFMVAKCEQRQVIMPSYDYSSSDKYDSDYKLFDQKFKSNVLFSKFVKEFSGTKFYQYTYTRCSYLRDFVAKGKSR